jgi:molybdopterin synthase sulfur carrier subunit
LTEAYSPLHDKLWDAEGDWSGFVTVLLNGRSVQWLQGLETLVADDDALSLFPPVGGG